MSTTTIPTKLAHDIAARLCQEADTTARELRSRLIDCMQDATSPGLALLPFEPVCDECGGSGALYGGSHRNAHDCPACHGSGKPIEPAANAPEVEPVRAEASEWRANLEADQEAEQDEFKPVAGPLSLLIFVDGEYVEARDACAPPREREVIIMGGDRFRVHLVEWPSGSIAHVHTQPLLRLPSADGGPF